MFFIHHVLGVRPHGDALWLKPKLLSGVDKIISTVIVRGQKIAIEGPGLNDDRRPGEAARIVDVPQSVKRLAKTNSGMCHAVIGMEAMLNLCARRGVMFHESGLFPWTVPPSRKDLRGYARFNGPRKA